MVQKKQTARKTTGTHRALANLLSRSIKGSSAKRVRYDPLANSIHGQDPSPLRSKRSRPTPIRPEPSTTPRAASPKPASSPHTPGELPPVIVPDAPSVSQPNGSTFTFGTVARRHPLHTAISACIRFATWLESQKCVHEHVLVQAVERDGGQLLSLAKATIAFDNALRGNVLPPVNGVEGVLGEYARTFRVFAQLLQSKISEGTLSDELEKAVLRDGEPLLRLALCCLDFERAVQG